MKKIAALLTVFALTFSAHSHAEGWLDSIKSMFGMSEETQEVAPNISDMVKMVTDNLGVEKNQAEGGLGSIFNYAKENLDTDQFSQLSGALPGIGDLISAAPDVSKLTEQGGLSGLMDKAAQYNDSLKAVNEVKKQFEALGLKPEMIMQFVQQAKAYLDTEQGQQAKALLTQGVGKLLG